MYQQSVSNGLASGFDGFRFDLMGILDITTMKQIARELKAIHQTSTFTEKVGRCLLVLIVTFWLISSTLNNYNYGFFANRASDTIKQTIVKGRSWTKSLRNQLTENIPWRPMSLTGESAFPISAYSHRAINYKDAMTMQRCLIILIFKVPNIGLRPRLAANSRLALHRSQRKGVPFLHGGRNFIEPRSVDNTYNLPDDVQQARLATLTSSLHYTGH